MAEPAPRTVTVVPHTHWDREWYAGFQTFRLKLVDLLDELLPRLEADPSFTHFLLDGQMAVVDDYLAVRPEAADRLRRLVGAGRLSVGPWQVLMDEFLVSGETIVRNLQAGLARAGAFGGAMEVGYLPDMFGHVAQMPQLLDQFGLAHAVVWRGVPAAIDRSGFWWEAPDGSTVRAEYLPEGYWNGQKVPAEPAALVDRIHRFEQRWGDLLVGGVLWMGGMDHEVPPAWLGKVVAEADATDPDHAIRVGSLADHLAAAPTEGLPRWRGELRSGARANLLMGVASNRVDVKQSAAAAERWLERVAEPAAAAFLPAEAWPGEVLDVAWREVIRNSAHDSSCACSIDEVCDAVLVRYAEARQVAEGVAERAARAVADQLVEAGEVLVSTTARPRAGLVEMRLWGRDPWTGTQVLGPRGGVRPSAEVPLPGLVELVAQAVDNAPELDRAQVVLADGVVEVRLAPAGSEAAASGRWVPAGDAADEVRDRAEEDPDGVGRLAIVLPESQKVLGYVPEVPGFGWARWGPADLPVDPVVVEERADGSVAVANGRAAVVVDPGSGTFALDGTAGLGRLVDDGDVGDTYNWCPPTEQRVVDRPTAVAVRVLERGPLRARVAVDATYPVPVRAEGMDRRAHEVDDLAVTTTLEVQAGSPLVRVTHELDNRAEDHRLRAHLPLPSPARTSRAECAYAVVERGLVAEGGPSEAPLPTYPMRRFVQAGGLTVVTDGLLEYELVDLAGEGDGSRAGELALTLLRCTGLLSQGPMATRPLPAGPVVPTPGAQLPGRQVLRWAVAATDDVAEAHALADEAFTPLLHVRAPGGGRGPDVGSALVVTGAEVDAVVRRSGAVEVRVHNPGDEATTVALPGRRGWLVDLRGRPVEPFDGAFPLRPWGIATARLDER